MRKIVYYFCIIGIISCTETKEKKVFLRGVKMNIYNEWQCVQQESIDSYVYFFITEKSDTILVDIGRYSNSLNEIIGVSSIKEYDDLKKNKFPVKEMFFSETPNIDENQGVFHKEYYYYEEIDYRKAKIQVPKKVGKGRTSISFNNVINQDYSILITGENLDSITQFRLLKTFYSIQFME